MCLPCRSVKRETLKLIETFVDKAEDTELIAKNFVPAMMDPILGDYARNVSDARESEVLSLFATIINKCVWRAWLCIRVECVLCGCGSHCVPWFVGGDSCEW